MTEREPLTPAQRRVYDWVRGFITSHGYSPGIREIGDGLKLTSTNGVSETLSIVVRKGYLTRVEGKARTLTLPLADRAIPRPVLTQIVTQTDGGPVVCQGWQIIGSVWAVNSGQDAGEFVVTHLPSGLRCPGPMELAGALGLLYALHPYQVKTSNRAQAAAAFPAPLRKALRLCEGVDVPCFDDAICAALNLDAPSGDWLLLGEELASS